MDIKLKTLIKDRAISLFPVIRDQLNIHYELDPSVGSCFKYLYLYIHGPNKFLKEFGKGDLKINVSDVRDVFFDFAEYIPGNYGLQDYEEEIIHRHNTEVDAYYERKNVVLPYRQSSIGLARKLL